MIEALLVSCSHLPLEFVSELTSVSARYYTKPAGPAKKIHELER